MMSVEKVEITAPPSYQYPVISQDAPQKTSKRHLLIGGVVAVVVVVALVIGGALGGLYLQNKHTLELSKEYTLALKDASGKKIEEKVKVDVNNNQEEHTSDNGQMKVIDDFNKGITVMRTSIKNKYACYVKPFNKTGVVEPAALKDYLDTHKGNSDEDKVEEDDKPKQAYEPASDPIKDISFLGESVQEMCKGLDAYWLLPTTEMARTKRGLCWKYRCYIRYYRCIRFGKLRICYRYWCVKFLSFC